MKRSVVILTIIASGMTMLYHLYNLKPLTATNSRAQSEALLPDSSPLLKFQKPSKSAVANMDVWNLKPPAIPLGQMLSLKDMFKPVYTLILKDRVHTLQRSDRPNQGWEFQGILGGKRPKALLYNTGTNKLKTAGIGDVIDEQLTVHAIGSGSVTLEARDGKKPQYFELRIFNKLKAEKPDGQRAANYDAELRNKLKEQRRIAEIESGNNEAAKSQRRNINATQKKNR
jgi:hypothetical protein